MTNLLLLLILLAVLGGFGFLIPVLWVVGAIVGLLIFTMVLGTIAKGFGALIEAVGNVIDHLFAPIGKIWMRYIQRIPLQWVAIGVIVIALLCLYINSAAPVFIHLLVFPAILALLKAVSLLDTISIQRKYASQDTDNYKSHTGRQMD
jgi:hypothetical protein